MSREAVAKGLQAIDEIALQDLKPGVVLDELSEIGDHLVRAHQWVQEAFNNAITGHGPPPYPVPGGSERDIEETG